jgi:hypothetical protein
MKKRRGLDLKLNVQEAEQTFIDENPNLQIEIKLPPSDPVKEEDTLP